MSSKLRDLAVKRTDVDNLKIQLIKGRKEATCTNQAACAGNARSIYSEYGSMLGNMMTHRFVKILF